VKTLTDLPLTCFPLAQGKLARFADRMLGEAVPDTDIAGCEGDLYSREGVVLVSPGKGDSFVLLMRLGECWRIVASGIPPHDPVVSELRAGFVSIPDPAQEAAEARDRARKVEAARKAAEQRDAEAKRLKTREAEWRRNGLIKETLRTLTRGSGEELAKARQTARELGLKPPPGFAW
jgi:hypothetical protein